MYPEPPRRREDKEHRLNLRIRCDPGESCSAPPPAHPNRNGRATAPASFRVAQFTGSPKLPVTMNITPYGKYQVI